MGRKPINNHLTTVISIRIPLELLKKLKDLQTDLNKDFPEAVRECLRVGVEMLEKVAMEKAIEKIKMEDELGKRLEVEKVEQG
jgi:predicted DNA-binding protein